MTKNILMVGVGGQGTILASKLLTIGLLEAGYDVKMSEIHGMSQRGGSVSSQIRYGKKVYSPVVEVGSSDIIVAFEKLEALRYIEYLKEGGEIIVNDYEINPMPVLSLEATYPSDIIDYIKGLKCNLTLIDAISLARELKNEKVLNVILLGVLINKMGLTSINWDKIIEENVKSAFVELNKNALKMGMNI